MSYEDDEEDFLPVPRRRAVRPPQSALGEKRKIPVEPLTAAIDETPMEEEDAPAAAAAPKPKRGPKKANRILPEGTRASPFVIKTSLSSLLQPESSLREWLPEALEYCNKTRVLMTLVMKLHLFTLLEQDSARLPFPINQNYVSRVRTAITSKDLRTACNYGDSLQAAAGQLIDYNQLADPWPLIPCPRIGDGYWSCEAPRA